MKTKRILFPLILIFCLAFACTKNEYDMNTRSKQFDILQNTRFKIDSIFRHITADSLLQDALGISVSELHYLLAYDDTGLYYDVEEYVPIIFEGLEETIDLSALRQMVEKQKFDIDTLRIYGDITNLFPISMSLVLNHQKDTIDVECMESKEASVTLSNIRYVSTIDVSLSGYYNGNAKIRPGQDLSLLITSGVTETGITFNEDTK